jgi:hypothetical protein
MEYISNHINTIRLSALIDLYIHPLYIVVIKILSSIPNSSATIHPLYYPLSILVTVGAHLSLYVNISM